LLLLAVPVKSGAGWPTFAAEITSGTTSTTKAKSVDITMNRFIL
jgi:peptide methionine sulfoxide reductase MsrB